MVDEFNWSIVSVIKTKNRDRIASPFMGHRNISKGKTHRAYQGWNHGVAKKKMNRYG